MTNGKISLKKKKEIHGNLFSPKISVEGYLRDWFAVFDDGAATGDISPTRNGADKSKLGLLWWSWVKLDVVPVSSFQLVGDIVDEDDFHFS